MNILITSDTHGEINKFCEMFYRISSKEKIDLIFHLGDYQDDAKEIASRLSAQLISVPGNCDHFQFTKRKIEVFDSGFGKILLTHGHTEDVNYSLDKLIYLAKESDCAAACYGHTHIAFYENIDGITVLNPGSLTKPRDGSSGTCALMKIDKNGISAEIIPCKTPDAKPAKTSRISGGYLRSLMNYSDSL